MFLRKKKKRVGVFTSTLFAYFIRFVQIARNGLYGSNTIHFFALYFRHLTMESHDHYTKIKQAIEYILANRHEQPSLAQVAQAIELSEFHFQRLFSEWVGASPKQFLQFVNVNYAKHIMQRKDTIPTLFDVTEEVGLSSTSRLHDLFVSIESMTPSEYANGGKNLTITYAYDDTLFGKICIASTSKGICHVSFISDSDNGLSRLKADFPHATYVEEHLDSHQQVSDLINNISNSTRLKLHLKGTPFQLKVWEALLTIPSGQLTTYGQIADQVGNSKASRAVGTAIGKNPISCIIPCHRVIQQTGLLGGYMWGPERKRIILGWELTKSDAE